MLRYALAIAVVGLLSPISVAQAKTLCTVMADSAENWTLRQEGTCDQPVTAASTFKVAISLMGYDAGFLEDEHSPKLPFREGYPDWIPSWRTDTDPSLWMRNSVVWYSQQVTQALGEKRFREYVESFDYGNKDVSGDPGKDNGLTRSWLSSSLRISPIGQVNFLRDMVGRKFPLSPIAYDMTARITLIDTLPGGWQVHGKTGSGPLRNADGSMNFARAYGWFVGWAEREGRTVVFARLIQNEKREKVSPGLRARDAFMKELPSLLPAL